MTRKLLFVLSLFIFSTSVPSAEGTLSSESTLSAEGTLSAKKHPKEKKVDSKELAVPKSVETKAAATESAATEAAFPETVENVAVEATADKATSPEENALSTEVVTEEVAVVKYSEAELKAMEEAEKKRLRDEKVIGDIGGLTVSDSEYAQSSIKKYIASYSTERGKKRLFESLDNAETYRLYVRQQLKERNMPEILEYLPLIESDYVTTATSRVGAKGIWQFMENSIKPYLKKNTWVDERLDPWRSTDAAISKLQENYRMFGDWNIAIAAYNCGAGAMQKALKASKEKDFWYMAEKKILKSQTIGYVPKLIAVAEIAANNEFYDIPMPEITQSTRFAEFDYVLVKQKINIYRLASELRMDADYLKLLNPALIRSVTPANDEYEIRFPVGMEMSARFAIFEITSNPDKFWDDFESVHIVESGDTLWGISRKTGCTIEEICLLNKMKETDVLKIGKELKIPIPYQ